MKADGAAGSGAAEVVLLSLTPVACRRPPEARAPSVREDAQLWSKKETQVLKAPWSKLALALPSCLSSAGAWKQLVIPDRTGFNQAAMFDINPKV